MPEPEPLPLPEPLPEPLPLPEPELEEPDELLLDELVVQPVVPPLPLQPPDEPPLLPLPPLPPPEEPPPVEPPPELPGPVLPPPELPAELPPVPPDVPPLVEALLKDELMLPPDDPPLDDIEPSVLCDEVLEGGIDELMPVSVLLLRLLEADELLSDSVELSLPAVPVLLDAWLWLLLSEPELLPGGCRVVAHTGI